MSVIPITGYLPVLFLAIRMGSWIYRRFFATSLVMVDDGRPIFFAAETGNLEMVKLLMEFGTLFNVKDKHEKTPLSYAAASGHMDVVRYLASKGADVCAKDVQLAYENGHKAVANFLESIAGKYYNDFDF